MAGYDRVDPKRLVFADDGGCAEVCSTYAACIAIRDWYRFVDTPRREGDDVTRYADEPDCDRRLVLCLRCGIDAQDSADAMR